MSELIELPAVFLLRATQAPVLAMPTILTGMVTAGVLQVLVGGERLRRWIGAGTFASFCRAWVLAMLIPACGFGMIPVLHTAHRLGASPGSLVVLALAGPMLMPWTCAYMLDGIGSIAFVWLLLASWVSSIIVAFLVQKLGRGKAPLPEVPVSQPARSTLVSLMTAAGESMSPGVLTWIMVGAAGAGLLAILIPPNMIGQWMVERSAVHAVVLFAIPLLTYVSPEVAAMQAGEIVMSSTMPGLIIAFAFVGSAINAGVLAAAARTFGLRPAMIGLVTLLLCSAAAAMTLDRFILDPGFTPEDSHAFEDMGKPFHLLDHPDGPIAGFVHRWRRPMTSGAAVATICVIGMVILSRRRAHRAGALDVMVSGTPLSPRKMAMASVLLGFGYAGIFGYSHFPPPSLIAADIKTQLLEFDAAARAGSQAVQARQVARVEDRLRRLPVAAAIRGRRLSVVQKECIANLRAELAVFALKEQADPAHDMQPILRHSLKLERLLN